MPRGTVVLIIFVGFCGFFVLSSLEAHADHQNRRKSSLGNKAQLNALRTPGSIRYIGNTLILPPGVSTRVRSIGGRIVAPPGSRNFIRSLQVNRPALRGRVSGPSQRNFDISTRAPRDFSTRSIKAPDLRLARGGSLPNVDDELDLPERAAIAKDLRSIFRRADRKLDQALKR